MSSMHAHGRPAQSIGRFAVTVAVVAVAVGSTAALSAGPHQSGTNLERPPTWKTRYDTTGAVERSHVVMRPGWHINPGPAGIFWDPSRFAAGNFSVTSTIFLFPAGQGEPPSRVDEPYGLLIGGTNLERPDLRYVTFLLRNDGRFHVATHAGDRTTEVLPWTEHKALSIWVDGSTGTAKNTLAVDATADRVAFFINDEEVASVPRASLPVDGIAGLRAGADLSLHVTDLVIGPNRR